MPGSKRTSAALSRMIDHLTSGTQRERCLAGRLVGQSVEIHMRPIVRSPGLSTAAWQAWRWRMWGKDLEFVGPTCVPTLVPPTKKRHHIYPLVGTLGTTVGNKLSLQALSSARWSMAGKD